MKTQINKLSCIEIKPTLPAIASVIWLHGLGADGNDFVPMIPELQLPSDLPIRFIFPNASLKPVTINNGYVMRAWYDILSMNIEQRADRLGIEESVMQIHELIKNEESLGIPINKIILAGFSQGAVIALTAGLSMDKTLGGIMALSGYFPFAQETLAQVTLAARRTPIFMAHGTQDTIVPYQSGLSACDVLKRDGFTIDWQSYAMAHSVCEKEIVEISKWMQTVLQR